MVEEELVQVVDGSQEFDLGVDGKGAPVVEVASESLEELSEAGFGQGAASFVEVAAGGCGQPGCHLLLACGEEVVLRGGRKARLCSFVGHRDV